MSERSTGPKVQIEKLGGSSYRLTANVTLPKPRSEAFEFFADAANLAKITPDYLNFRILTPVPIEMREGARIDYRIRLHGIPIKWRTEISTWQPGERFVDQQIRGPYRRWHHEHLFIESGDKTLMTDVVDYRVWLGPILHPLMIRRDLMRIFEYRQAKIIEMFGHQR